MRTASIEELPGSDWPVGMSVGDFLIMNWYGGQSPVDSIMGRWSWTV